MRTFPLGCAWALILSCLSLGYSAHGQDLNGLSARLANHMEYSLSTTTNKEILENWLDVDLGFDNFTAGARMEIYQPSEQNTIEESITFRYAEYRRDRIAARVGNYYTMFGRGLVLRTYEDRNIRIDNNLEGVTFAVLHDRFSATALSGRARGAAGKRTDLVHGADITCSPVNGLSLGGSYLNNTAQLHRKKGIASARLAAFLESEDWNLDLYGEYGEKTEPQGKGGYVSSSLTTSGFGLSFEYKYYDFFLFQSEDGLVTYNNPPALVREHSYTLLNRHPYALNANDEVGIQVEATYSPGDRTSFVGNYSLTKKNDRSIWGDGEALFEEGYGEIEHHFNEELYCIGAASASEQGEETFITPILEFHYTLKSVNSLRGVLQHQHAKSPHLGEYDDQIYSLEYARSPKYTASLVGEWTNMSARQKELNQISKKNNFWLFGQVTVNISENHDLSIMYGSRQAGYVCAGGVCRYEPAFEGIEVKLFSRL